MKERRGRVERRDSEGGTRKWEDRPAKFDVSDTLPLWSLVNHILTRR